MLRRPLVACAVLLAVYVVLSLFNDPRAYLGTDTGGKVATLEVMTERNRLDPDIGYWAERWDPEGRVHPLYYTTRVGDRWVNATTLPMLYGAYPLYDLGGYRLALLLPMLGSVLAALAARALARRISGSDGWGAFWVVGLASPLLIYALDFWEHSLGVALMAWAIVLLVDLLEGRRRWPWALVAGGLFGLAATLRNEAYVYGFVAVGLACLMLLVGRRAAWTAARAGAAAAVGLVVPLVATVALERATMGDPARIDRAGSTASAAGTAAGQRLEEAMLNAVAITPSQDAGSYLVGGLLLALLVYFVLRTAKPGDLVPPLIVAVGIAVIYIARFETGAGFVPSLVAATPLAVVGLVLGWFSSATRYLLGVGLIALPLIWATQFQGGAAPQWGARYLLVSGLLFGVVGVVTLGRLRPWARTAAVGLAVAVTCFGVVWTSIRTHDFGATLAALTDRPEPVLVSRIGHLPREGGAFYRDRRWLTAPTEEDLAYALDVLERADVRRFAVVDLASNSTSRPPEGWRLAGTHTMDFVSGFRLRLTTYQAG